MYLDLIAGKFTHEQESHQDLNENMIKKENTNPNHIHKGIQKRSKKTVIVCDRNNTYDIWGDIKKAVDRASKENQFFNYKTIVMLPQMKPFDNRRYMKVNPICPELTYESIKRIFGRVKHGCLNASNKPKAVEVVLKFVKLYDGAIFSSNKKLHQFFDAVIRVDFLSQSCPMHSDVHDMFIEAYNNTPENFGVPSDEIINSVI